MICDFLFQTVYYAIRILLHSLTSFLRHFSWRFLPLFILSSFACFFGRPDAVSGGRLVFLAFWRKRATCAPTSWALLLVGRHVVLRYPQLHKYCRSCRSHHVVSGCKCFRTSAAQCYHMFPFEVRFARGPGARSSLLKFYLIRYARGPGARSRLYVCLSS